MGALVAFKSGGAVANLKKLAGSLRNASAMINIDDGLPILKLDKHSGEWSYGAENEPLDPKDLIAVNPGAFKHGYIAFNDAEVAFTVDGQSAEVLHTVDRELIDFDRLPELEEPRGRKKNQAAPEWKFQLAFIGMIINGPNKGTEVTYKPTSVGGLRFMRIITEEIAKRLEDDEAEIVPIIELYSKSYTHKKFGLTFTPEFEIVDWRAPDDSAPVKEETTAKGHPVDTRKKPAGRSRDAEDAEVIEDDERHATKGRRTETRGTETEEDAEERGSRKRGRPRKEDTAREDSEDRAPARSSRRPRDEEEEEQTDGDRETDRRDTRTARGSGRAAETSSRRPRDEEEEEQEEDARPRGKRGDDESAARSGPRGRGAASGRRSSPEADEAPARRSGRR